MNTPTPITVPTEDPNLKEMLRALQEAIWRIDTVLRAVDNDVSEDNHLSHVGELLAEVGMEAVSVSLDLTDQLPKALGMDISAQGDGECFKKAYIRARSADRAIAAKVGAEMAQS